LKFHLVINMERMDASSSYSEVARHVTEMVQIAEDAGFHMVWAAEHHGIEMTIAPDAFQILTWLAAHTSRIRLGTAVVVSPYAHPVRVAGQAALLDVYSDGRLDLGLGSGAYQWEMDRMKPGLKQQDAHLYTQELLPAVRALWEGDYSHEGEYWQFARMTSVPKPVQGSSPPVWIAARAPVTFDFAVKNNCNIMSWALARPFSEVELYKERFETALKDNPGMPRPVFATMRQTAVYEKTSDVDPYLDAFISKTARFENLFKNIADVKEGFPEQVDLESIAGEDRFNREELQKNLMFGTPDEVISKLEPYRAIGVDDFIYNASYGLDRERQKSSLKLFCREVAPAFA